MKTIFALLLVATGLTAAEPAIEIRFRPANDFVARLEFLGGCVGQGEQAKQFAEVVKVFGGAKGVIEGLDLKRPVGAFAVVTPSMVDSQIVVMLPVADEKAFLSLLTNRLNATPEKQDNGSHFFQLPGVGPPFYLRFHKDYACITIQDAKHVDADKLPDPKAFFGTPDAALAVVTLHIDRLPGELKKQILGQMELTLADKAKNADKNASAIERLFQWLATDGGLRGMKCALNDGRTLSLKLAAEPKTDDIALTATMTAKDGSDLKSTLAQLPKRTAKAARVAEAKNPILSIALNAGLPDSMNSELAKHVDEAINEMVKNAKGNDGEALENMLDAFAETFKAGDYELGAVLHGEGLGKLRLVGAMKAVKGGQFDRLVRDFAALIPAELGNLELDAVKQAAGNLHKFTATDENLKKYYGTSNVSAHLGESLFVLGLEPEGKASQDALTRETATSELLNVRMSWSRFSPLVEKAIPADTFTAMAKEIFGTTTTAGQDETALRITAGDALTIHLTSKSKSLRYLQLMDKKKKGQ